MSRLGGVPTRASVYTAMLNALRDGEVTRSEERGKFQLVEVSSAPVVRQAPISAQDTPVQRVPTLDRQLLGLSVAEAATVLARRHGVTSFRASDVSAWLDDVGYVSKSGQPPSQRVVYSCLLQEARKVEVGGVPCVDRGEGRGVFIIGAAAPAMPAAAPAQDVKETQKPVAASGPKEIEDDVGITEAALRLANKRGVRALKAEEVASWFREVGYRDGALREGEVRIALARASKSGKVRMESNGTYTIAD